VYTRQSLDRTGDEAAVTRQREDCHKLCADRGWIVAATVVDNDVSASNGKARPGFARVLAMVDAREVDVVVVWATDRLVRKLAELEDVIERCERAGVRLATVSGDLDLSTDSGRLVGRILASVARGEVERKGARQRRANQQRAENGEVRGWSHRPFGYTADKTTPCPVEATAVRDGCAQLLSGGSLRSLATQWNAAKLAPPQRATRWTATTVRAVLLNPRIAGLSTYRGDIVGNGTWTPLVDEPTWHAVHALLTDDGRRAPRGARSLLGGLARCSCGAPMRHGNNSRGRPIYRCSMISEGPGTGHVARLADPVDDLIRDVVVGRLSRPDAAELLVDQDRPDVDALRAEARVLRAKLDEIAREFADDRTVTVRQVRTMTERVKGRLAAVDEQMADAGRRSVLGPLIGAEDVRAVWEGLDIDRQRAVVDTLMTITLRSPGQGARMFDPDTVQIEWREQER